MSDQSRIALNKYFNITNPYVLCINETKKDMTNDLFDNYTVVSAFNGAMIIHSSLPYQRLYLLNFHFDSIWINFQAKKRLSLAPHIFNPTLLKKMQHFINSLGILKSYCVSNALDGQIFSLAITTPEMSLGGTTLVTYMEPSLKSTLEPILPS